MAKNKMITKGCPQCKQQVPVACKACPCGHTFFAARRAVKLHRLAKEDSGEVKRRRTERVKREKPDYYDPLEYDNQMKKQLKQTKLLRQQKLRSGGSSSMGGTEEDVKGDDDEEGKGKKRRKRKPQREKKEEEEDIMANLPPEKVFQCSVVLAEINRKICATSWRV